MYNNRYRYLLILLLAGYSYINSLFAEVYFHYNIRSSWYEILLVFIVITWLVWDGSRLIQRRMKRSFPDQTLPAYLLAFFAAGVFYSALVALLVIYLLGGYLLGIPASDLQMPARLALLYSTRINLFLFIIDAVLYFVRQYKSKQLETEELKRINSQAQLQSIKNQVNPHFLFNNLNVLSSLVMQENADANKFIEAFSTVYRYVLNSQQQELIALRSEVDFLNPYIFLLQKRFPESIFIEADLPGEYQSLLIIPVAIQMLLENAIKHNFFSRSRPLRISLSIENANQLLVTNNIQPKPPEGNSSQIGLNNIAQRYEIITRKKIKILRSDSLFSVYLPLISPE